MKKYILPLLSILSIPVFGQMSLNQTPIVSPFQIQDPGDEENDVNKIYKLNAKIDVPVTVAATAISLIGFADIYSKDPSSRDAILALDKKNINSFDRWATKYYDTNATNASDIPFYGSIAVPFLLFIDKDIRQDFGKISFLYLETMAITGIFYTGTAMVFDRYRPYAYNENAPIEFRQRGVARNSFLGGHPCLVASATFFTAKVFGDYHPNSKLKYVLYGGAALATGTTAYLRLKGGNHFPSDLLVGMAVGTLSGILVPHFHKVKDKKGGPNLSMSPMLGKYQGLALNYKF